VEMANLSTGSRGNSTTPMSAGPHSFSAATLHSLPSLPIDELSYPPEPGDFTRPRPRLPSSSVLMILMEPVSDVSSESEKGDSGGGAQF
jgi:hypothetical protein